jgi:NADH-quinone oxidoreductase subunit N
MGYALLGLAAGTAYGVQSMLVYMAIYVTMNIGTFAFILSMERDGKPVSDIASLNMLSKREPMKAYALLVLMFSLAGVPPFIGFFAKFAVLTAAVEAGLTWAAVAGVIASVIGAFYYLRIVYFTFFGADTDGADSRMDAVQWLVFVAAVLVVACGAAVSLFGIDGSAAIAAEALVR